MNKYLSFLPVILAYFLLSTIPAHAVTMSNGNLQLQIQEVTPSPAPTAEKPKEIPNVFEGVNYTEDVRDNVPLSLTSALDLIDFGPLSPTNPIIRTSTLSIFDPSLRGFEVIAFENHPLSSEKSKIEDASCDNGLCTQENSSPWINTLSYGFGYRCDPASGQAGTVCADGFKEANFFKQFSNQSIDEYPKIVANGQRIQKSFAVMTYKVNIPSSLDTKASYRNTITYIVVPNL